MKKKDARIAVIASAAALLLGGAAITAGKKYSHSRTKPKVSIDYFDIIDGEEGAVEFDYSWNNIPDNGYEFRYIIETDEQVIAEALFPAVLPSYSPSVQQTISVPYPVAGKYKITTQIIKDGSVISKDSKTILL